MYRQHLRSAATGTLLVPRTRTATGQRSFAVNGPATWSRLPPALRSPDLSDCAFKRALNTHLFSTAQRHWDVFMILAPDINIRTYLLTYYIPTDYYITQVATKNYTTTNFDLSLTSFSSFICAIQYITRNLTRPTGLSLMPPPVSKSNFGVMWPWPL